MKWKLLLRSLVLSCLFLISLCGAGSVVLAEGFAPGCPFPVITVPAPESSQVQSYLGLKTKEPFTLSDVQAKVVVVEFLNALCTQCIANAPTLNKLYKVTQQDAALSKDVKIIGIAIGNSQTELDAFKKNTKTPFPIFLDEKLAIAEVVELSGTPTMVLVAKNGETLSCHRGAIKDFDGFLKDLREILKKQR
jgi:thiol-disulfide isomerase/thioredoxin